MIKLKNVEYVMQTGIDKYVVLSSYNKTIIYDLFKQETAAEFAGSNGCYFNIAFENYVGIAGNDIRIVDLNSMQVVYKFSPRAVVKKYVLPEKYRRKPYYLEDFSISLEDIDNEKIIIEAYYNINSYDDLELIDKKSVLCAFRLDNGEFIYTKEIPSNYVRLINRERTRYDFCCYDDEIISTLLVSSGVKTKANLKYDVYNIKYGTIFHKTDNYYCVCRLDEEQLIGDGEKIIPEYELFSQENFNLEEYVIQNGVTDNVLSYFDDDAIFESGYGWAEKSAEKRAKDKNCSLSDILDEISEEELIFYSFGWFETMINADGLGEYFTGEDNKTIGGLIKAMKLVGATEDLKTVKKALNYRDKFHACEEINEKHKYLNKLEYLTDELQADWKRLSINYIKKKRGICISKKEMI